MSIPRSQTGPAVPSAPRARARSGRGRWQLIGLRGRIALAVWVATAFALAVAGVLADASLRRSQAVAHDVQYAVLQSYTPQESAEWAPKTLQRTLASHFGSAMVFVPDRAGALVPVVDDGQVASSCLFDDAGVCAGHVTIGFPWQGKEAAMTAWLPSTDRAAVSRLRRQMAVLLVGGSTLAALAAWLVAGWISRPVRVAGEVATRFGAGDLDARIPERGNDDVTVLARQFNQMADSVNQMLEAQRHFISDTAHELRTPTAALVATASALESPVTRDEASGMVVPQLRRLSSLTEDLLALARFDSSREQLRTQKVDLAGLCAASVRGVGEPAQVRVWALGDEPVEVEVDAVRVQTIVRNLVVNGLKHGAPPVTVMVQRAGEGATITVADDGPGVPLDKGERLFDRFVRGDDARHGTGSGLGLAIARENARLHGGDLTLDEGGHAFRLTLPGVPSTPGHEVVLPEVRRRASWRTALVSRLLASGTAVAVLAMVEAIWPGAVAPRVFGFVPAGRWTQPWAPWLASVATLLAVLVASAMVLHAVARVVGRWVPIGLVLVAAAATARWMGSSGRFGFGVLWLAVFVLPLLLPLLFDPRRRR